MKEKRIVVLMGGPSKEAEVSRRTAGAIAEALQSKGYKANTLECNPTTVVQDLQQLECDVVFNAIHGKYGEDGALQGALEMAGIPYTGSGIMAHAVGMNKKMSKHVFLGAQIPTARSKSYDQQQQTLEEILTDITSNFTVPFVVKAASQGSSIGVSIIKEASKVEQEVKQILEIDHVIVVEDFVDGREFTVSVLDGKALPVIEIRPHSGEYDYASKYTTGATEYLVPAPITEEQSAKMQQIGESVYRQMQCAGVIRVDIMMNDGEDMFVLEYNTVPGMTATSLVPKAAKAVGIEFPELCEQILHSAGLHKF